MTSERRLGLLFLLVGPPGVGKNTLMNAVLKRVPDLRQLPTATTRAIRPTERQGREHLFVSHAQFQQMISDNALIERQQIHGEWYGIPKTTVEDAIRDQQDLIADIDVLGATYVRSMYPDNTVLIFIQPASTDDLKRRMQQRGETEAEIEKRMQRVALEMPYAPLCDYLITNDDNHADQAAEILHGVVLAERSHRALLNLRAERDLPRHKLAYVASVVAVFEGQVICRIEDARLPAAQFNYGEFPHEAALRALRQDLNLIPSVDDLYPDGDTQAESRSFVLPVTMDIIHEAHHEEITFYYLYRLPKRITPPIGWDYLPFDQIDLLDTVQTTIQAVVQDLSNEKVESSHEPA